MPVARDNAVMACAATPNAWYAWISPWLLGESEDPQQLIPFGDPSVPRIVVGHNVSFDRKRIREEYSVEPTQTRFLDTMSLHVAVKGISSHQRGAWQKYRKSKAEEDKQRLEAIESMQNMMDQGVEVIENETDAAEKERLEHLMHQIEEGLRDAELQTSVVAPEPEPEPEDMAKRWEDQSSLSSLEDVALLYCGIVLNKETRDDFLSSTREEILDDISSYLDYCASDVWATHAVFTKTLRAFLRACPSPVSFAGILTMGSSLLTVNEEWEAYLANAERVYRDMEDKVKKRLIELAEQAKIMMADGKWKEDVWLSQLDWTPKVAGKSRGIVPSEVRSDPFHCTPSYAHLQSDCIILRSFATVPRACRDRRSCSLLVPRSGGQPFRCYHRSTHPPPLAAALIQRRASPVFDYPWVALLCRRRGYQAADSDQEAGFHPQRDSWSSCA